MVIVWWIKDDSPNSPNFLLAKLSCYMVCKLKPKQTKFYVCGLKFGGVARCAVMKGKISLLWILVMIYHLSMFYLHSKE